MKQITIILITMLFAISCDISNSIDVDVQIDKCPKVCTDSQIENVYGKLISRSYEDSLQYFNLIVIDNTSNFSKNDTIKIFIPSNIRIKPVFNRPFDYSIKCNNNKWFFN